jgi:MFS family permease
VQDDFDVPRIIALLPFVLYLLGLSFGPIVAGPSSETWGRRAVYISTIPCVAAFTLGAGFSQNITSLAVCRFFAGLFASPGLSIGAPSLADVWPPEKRGAPIAIMITMVQLGPATGE